MDSTSAAEATVSDGQAIAPLKAAAPPAMSGRRLLGVLRQRFYGFRQRRFIADIETRL